MPQRLTKEIVIETWDNYNPDFRTCPFDNHPQQNTQRSLSNPTIRNLPGMILDANGPVFRICRLDNHTQQNTQRLLSPPTIRKFPEIVEDENGNLKIKVHEVPVYYVYEPESTKIAKNEEKKDSEPITSSSTSMSSSSSNKSKSASPVNTEKKNSPYSDSKELSKAKTIIKPIQKNKLQNKIERVNGETYSSNNGRKWLKTIKKRKNLHEPIKTSSKSVNNSLTHEIKTSDSTFFQNQFTKYRAVTKLSEMKKTIKPDKQNPSLEKKEKYECEREYNNKNKFQTKENLEVEKNITKHSSKSYKSSSEKNTSSNFVNRNNLMYNTDKISVKSNSKINTIKAKENCEGKSNSSHSIQDDRAGGKWLKTKKKETNIPYKRKCSCGYDDCWFKSK